jgi:hypothetical protein
MRRGHRQGFSLLEVLLATSILIGSTIVLLELVTIGNRHASSARDLTKSQMICQTELNEILAGAAPVEAVRPTPLDLDPQWIYWVELQPTEQIGFVAVEVGAAYEPVPHKQSSRFTLVRWMPDPRATSAPGEKPAGSPPAFAQPAAPRRPAR